MKLTLTELRAITLDVIKKVIKEEVDNDWVKQALAKSKADREKKAAERKAGEETKKSAKRSSAQGLPTGVRSANGVSKQVTKVEGVNPEQIMNSCREKGLGYADEAATLNLIKNLCSKHPDWSNEQYLAYIYVSCNAEGNKYLSRIKKMISRNGMTIDQIRDNASTDPTLSGGAEIGFKLYDQYQQILAGIVPAEIKSKIGLQEARLRYTNRIVAEAVEKTLKKKLMR